MITRLKEDVKLTYCLHIFIDNDPKKLQTNRYDTVVIEKAHQRVKMTANNFSRKVEILLWHILDRSNILNFLTFSKIQLLYRKHRI